MLGCSKLVFVVSVLITVCLSCVLALFGPLHASCKLSWEFPKVNCSTVNAVIVTQIKKWKTDENCKQGGEKCLYELQTSSPSTVKATHTTPVKKYVDDLTMDFIQSEKGCKVMGHSTSETWYAVLDYGTNYCNLYNLLTGAGLDKIKGFVETTSNKICTQYTSADCEKY